MKFDHEGREEFDLRYFAFIMSISMQRSFVMFSWDKGIVRGGSGVCCLLLIKMLIAYFFSVFSFLRIKEGAS